ncbi:MAG: NAD-dependent epimerase/dehydratase family protein [Opitutaceae bacterium]|nr:NAD-dependent epimerase/dehydratase family protein [Opitutaceae bacterium]
MTTAAEGNFSGQRLVIFGCGYVGAAVAAEALRRGMLVTAVTRNAANAVLMRAEGINAVVADLATTQWHGRVPDAPELALNCVSAGSGGVEGYRHSYVDGMASIVAWARDRGAVGTVLYTSSTSVYPQADGAVVDEAAPTTAAGERGRILLEAERQLRESTAACHRWFILRIAGIYGPGRHHVLDQVRAGELPGVGGHHLNLAHRDDIANAIWACFAAPTRIKDQIFNVADDQPASKTEVVAWLAARIDRPVPSFTGEPHSARRTITPDRVIANAKLKSTLGWSPRYPSFREGYEILLSR